MSDTVRTILAATGFFVGLYGFLALIIGGETDNGRAQGFGVAMIALGFVVFVVGAWNY